MGSGTAGETSEVGARLGFWDRRAGLSALAAGLAALLACAFVASLDPAPHPRSFRDFSTLLLADTLRHARLANPVPAFAKYLQSPEVLIAPHYVSAQPPLQALFPWLGLAFGNPFVGSALGFALGCAALVWMLRAWVPGAIAVAAALCVALQLHLAEQLGLSLGPAAPLFLAAALVLGALPRLAASGGSLAAGSALGTGALLLVVLDPLSAGVVALLALGFGVAVRIPAPRPGGLAVAASILALGLAWHGYYNLRTTGEVLSSPAALYAARHGKAPELVIQAFDASRSYERPNPSFEGAYSERGVDSKPYFRRQGWQGFWSGLEPKLERIWRGVAGLSGSVLVALALLGWRERAVRLALSGWVLFLALAALRSRDDIAHVAAALPLFFLLVAIALQRVALLRLWKLPAGVLLAAYAVMIAVADHTEALQNERVWAEGSPLAAREGVVSRVTGLSPRALVLTAYRSNTPSEHEWVYNGADPDAAPILWLREGSPEENAELVALLSDREIWLGASQHGSLGVERHPKRLRWWLEREAKANPRLALLSDSERRALERWYRSQFEKQPLDTERERIRKNVRQLARSGEIPELAGLSSEALERGVEENVERRLENRRRRLKHKIYESRVSGLLEQRWQQLAADPSRDPELAVLPEEERRRRLLESVRQQLAESAFDEEKSQAETLARVLAIYRGPSNPTP